MNQDGRRHRCKTDSVLVQFSKVSIMELKHELALFTNETTPAEQKDQIKLSPQGASFYPDISLPAFPVAALTRQTI